MTSSNPDTAGRLHPSNRGAVIFDDTSTLNGSSQSLEEHLDQSYLSERRDDSTVDETGLPWGLNSTFHHYPDYFDELGGSCVSGTPPVQSQRKEHFGMTLRGQWEKDPGDKGDSHFVRNGFARRSFPLSSRKRSTAVSNVQNKVNIYSNPAS